jgi:hypothetical protein
MIEGCHWSMEWASGMGSRTAENHKGMVGSGMVGLGMVGLGMVENLEAMEGSGMA